MYETLAHAGIRITIVIFANSLALNHRFIVDWLYAVDESESVSRHLSSGLMIPEKSEIHQPVTAFASAGDKVFPHFDAVKFVTAVRAAVGKLTVRTLLFCWLHALVLNAGLP